MIYYCSHAYGNNEENKEDIEHIIIELQTKDTGNTYFSPIHAFGFMYDELSYEEGLDLCLDMLEVCDALIVCSQEISRGVAAEIELAKRLDKQIIYLTEDIQRAVKNANLS